MNNPPWTKQVESNDTPDTTERVLTVRMFAADPTKFEMGAVVGPYVACAKWYSQQAVLVRRLACRNGLEKCILIRHRADAESMETFRAVMPPWPTVDDDACIEFLDRASVAAWLQTEHPRLAEAIGAHDAGPIVVTVFGWVFVLPIPPEQIDGHILRPHHAGLESTRW